MKSLNLSKLFITLCIFTGSVIYFNSAYAATIPSDISKHWAKADITSAANEQWALVQNGKFNPNKSAAREEVAWMLIGACKTIQTDGFDINKRADLKKFKDKPSTWAEGRMAIAVGNELIKGYPDGKLKPQSPITRAELSVLLSRKVKDEPPAGFSPFWDYIPEWALDGIKRVYAKGIIKGYPNGSFKANNEVTKAEALVMIKRWKKLQPKLIGKAEIPEEFKKISNAIPDVKVSASGLSHKAEYSVTYYPQNEAFVLMIRGGGDEVMKDIKTILQVFYPTGYEEAYNYFLEAEETKKDIKDKLFDGKTYECVLEATSTIIKIGRK